MSEVEALRASNPRAHITFIEGQVALIRGVDAVCEQIKQQVGNIDLLFMSQGYLSFQKTDINEEGLDNRFSVGVYGRIRLAQQLLPIMSENARVMSVLMGGKEGPLLEHNLDLLKDFSVVKSIGHFASMMTLSLDGLSQQHPGKVFMHMHPGSVDTGMFARSNKGVTGAAFRYIIDPLFALIAMTVDECGERMLYFGFDGERKPGSYSLDKDGKVVEVEALADARRNGWPAKVLGHDLEVFQRVVSK